MLDADNYELIILHRGPNVWNQYSFGPEFEYYDQTGFIKTDPIIHLDPQTGVIRSSWGKGWFVLPHSVSVIYELDKPTAVWITDVALHQAMKFDWGKWTKPSLVLGTKFQPGNGPDRFCQPTDVVVTNQVSWILFFLETGILYLLVFCCLSVFIGLEHSISNIIYL